ncbi:C69 family dipeptidase [Levyella massiliensis]|uniref:C69 family dipeptidase n=1 Tax=Levyella massiliensis TaxID=938289 RepID=UPI0023F5120F|nr:C69 family dipeptidase [Levyella massiliensis]
MRMKKAFTACALAFALLLTVPQTAFACTGVIVGSDLTKDGSTIFGRTEDLETNHNKAYVIHEAGKYKKGDVIRDVSYSEKNGYTYTCTKDSYRYTAVNDTTPEYGIFDEAGFNEKGLIVDMTVSANANEAVLKVDPLLDGEGDKPAGISEAIMPTVVLSQCATPEEAIRLLASEVAKKGAAEGNCFVVANKSDLWYMEIYTGHQFLAMCYPKDKFSVFPNTFWINQVKLEKDEETEDYYVSKDKNYIYSKGLFETAEKADTFKGTRGQTNDQNFAIDGTIQARESYAESEVDIRDASRAASGIKVLNPSASASINDKAFPFLQKAAAKSISLEQVLSFTRNRFDGKQPTNDTGEKGYYPIGNRNVMEAHVFQIPKNATNEFPAVQYMALGSTLVSPFVPYYPNQNGGAKAAVNSSNEYTNESLYWTAMDVLHMVETNRAKYQPIVDTKLNPLQKEILKAVSLKDQGAKANTEISVTYGTKAHEMLLGVQKELKADLLKNGYTSASEKVRRVLPGNAAYLTVPANVTDTVWKIAINGKTHDMTITDAYGNPVKVPAGVKLQVSVKKRAFETLKPTFYGQKIHVVLKNDQLYVFDVSVADNSVVRYSGTDRYAVNAKTVEALKDSENVVLTSGVAYADALMAVPYAKTVTIIGGANTIAKTVEKDLHTVIKAEVKRISASDRFVLSAEVAKVFKEPKTAMIANGLVPTDALTSGPVSQQKEFPILLVAKKGFDAKVESYLKNTKSLKKAILVGGKASISEESEKAIAGFLK